MRAMANEAGVRPTPDQLLARSEAWRPWRAYAAQHLWAADPGLSAAKTSPKKSKDKTDDRVAA
jgi:AraC family transcriptional regulator of adaptative response / DNA-3-methyladenine glycosylase II